MSLDLLTKTNPKMVAEKQNCWSRFFGRAKTFFGRAKRNARQYFTAFPFEPFAHQGY